MKPAGSYRSLLSQVDFLAYLFSQFMTAFNDNAFKIVVMLIALQSEKSGYVDFYYFVAQLVFILPFFLFAGYSGYFSDKYQKNRVIIYTKGLEIIIMLSALYFLVYMNKPALIFVLFLLSTQSTFLSPAKYGILPEWFEEQDISRANGLVELLTFVAIILGSAIGGMLMQYLSNDLIFIGIILSLFAVVSFITSFYIKSMPVSGTKREWRFNPWYEIGSGVKVLLNDPLIATIIGGISFFFAIALAVTTNLLVFGKEIFDLSEIQLGFIQATMGLGIGAGSILAGFASGDKIELGLIPLGAIGITACLFGISYATTYVLTLYLLLLLLGVFAGLFIVPLNALLQELPDKHEKGRLIATNNFFNGAAMIITVLLLGFLQAKLKLTPDSIMYVLAWITLVFSVITLSFNPRFFVRFIILLVVSLFYRIDVIGRPNIPKSGPALVVSNHVSYIDGLILSSVLPRFIRYIAHRQYYDHPLLHHLMRFAYAIPIESGSEEKVAASIARAREALQEGHVVCIFAEGRLTRTGNLLQFKSGFEKIIEGLDNVPIIPVYLDQLWDSVFSPRNPRQLFRIPQQFPARVTVTLGDPMPADSKAWQVRLAVQELAVQARMSGQQSMHYLSVEFLKNATHNPFRYCIYDEQNNKKHSYAEFSSKVLYVAYRIKNIHQDEDRIGILLPSNYPSVLLNIAIVMAGKSVVNIPNDYDYNQVLKLKKELGLANIYTSRDDNNQDFVGTRLIDDYKAIDIAKVLAKINGKTNSLKWRIIGLLKYIMPVKLVVNYVGMLPESTEAEISILIKNNKYIRVSHETIYNNIAGIKSVIYKNRADKIASSINFHNPYAYTASLWLPFIIGVGQVGIESTDDKLKKLEQIYRQKATILISNKEDLEYYLSHAPVNLLGYVHNIVSIDFLDNDFIDEFDEKFSVRILLCYGISELGPYITLSKPNIRVKGMLQRGYKKDSVGHPLPNVATRIISEQNGDVLPPGMEGILEVKTPAHMIGYFNKEITSKDGKKVENEIDEWFNTGLTAIIDEDGFVFIR